MSRCAVILHPGNKRYDVPAGTLLIDALADMGVFVPSPCGGKGICGKCVVRIAPERSDVPAIPADAWRAALACRTTVVREMTVFVDEARVYRHHAPKIDPRADLGVAVDIGTTTVKLSFVDLLTGNATEIDSFLNPQRRYGDDVISRIASASDDTVRLRMRDALRQAISTSIARAATLSGIDPAAVKTIAYSGNTAMLYLLAGLSIASLGVHPYRAPHRELTGMIVDSPIVPACPSAEEYLLPIASAFLGGDLVGGLALTAESDHAAPVFFIDLGTNGEMFLAGAKGPIAGTSCAMGPALEGMNISSGMTASSGAITRFDIADGSLSFEVVGGGAPLGIAGTGLIDIVSLLLRSGCLGTDGAIRPDAADGTSWARLETNAGVRRFRLADAVSITQKDIRTLQLARGASHAAARLLLEETGTDPAEIETVIVSGALGSHANPDSFRRLRFLPDFPRAAYRFPGNTSLAAAERACGDRSFRDRMRDCAARLRVIELSDHPRFNDEFLASLNFS